MNRFALAIPQLLFSIVTPFLLIPRIAENAATRRIVAACFGRAYQGRYERIIETFQGRYGAPLSAGLDMVEYVAEKEIHVVADCGTGTGYAVRVAAARFPEAIFLGFDLLEEMLLLAKRTCSGCVSPVGHFRADSFALPLPDFSVDMVIAMNTLPCFSEFTRICRPGGVILYVDSSAGWITRLAKRLACRQMPSALIRSRAVDLGFFMVIQPKGEVRYGPSPPSNGSPEPRRFPA